MFDGTDYAFWSIRMRRYLMELGSDIWKSIVNGYTTLTTPTIETTRKKLGNDNVKAINVVLCGLKNL